jgi:hypothetical protein
LAVLTALVITVAAARLLAALIFAVVLAAAAGVETGIIYAKMTRADRRRAAARPARTTAPPHQERIGLTGSGRGSMPSDAALRATLRARADQVSQSVSPAGKSPERPS